MMAPAVPRSEAMIRSGGRDPFKVLVAHSLSSCKPERPFHNLPEHRKCLCTPQHSTAAHPTISTFAMQLMEAAADRAKVHDCNEAFEPSPATPHFPYRIWETRHHLQSMLC
mmetsp:Transcript_59037/g.97627  ORF Transcript_59037/g.97627 Transcript_59037/m.97627 type:complete len:111 (-) Transcript_59037:227-559(-)